MPGNRGQMLGASNGSKCSCEPPSDAVGAAVSIMAAMLLKAQGSAAGRIDTLHGGAFAEGAIPRRSLRMASDVFVGDRIETEINSGLTMHLGKATLVKLGALCLFCIDKFVVDAGGVLDLDKGALVICRQLHEHLATGCCTDRQAAKLFPIVHRAATASRFQAVICVGWTSSLVAARSPSNDLE